MNYVVLVSWWLCRGLHDPIYNILGGLSARQLLRPTITNRYQNSIKFSKPFYARFSGFRGHENGFKFFNFTDGFLGLRSYAMLCRSVEFSVFVCFCCVSWTKSAILQAIVFVSQIDLGCRGLPNHPLGIDGPCICGGQPFDHENKWILKMNINKWNIIM